MPRKKHQRQDSTRRHVLNELRLTKMLLAISLTCLSLNFPSYYLRLIVFYEQANDDLTVDERYSSFALYRDILLHNLSYLSYSVNIVIYILFGANFRRALKRVFVPNKKINSKLLKLKAISNDNDTWSLDYSVAETTTSFISSLRNPSKSPKHREQATLHRELLKKQIERKL